jgi:hypothetical protein
VLVRDLRFSGENCPKTVANPVRHPACPKTPADSFAVRCNFCSASRFICNFICEYFLNTFASPCRRSLRHPLVGHAGAQARRIGGAPIIDAKYGTFARRSAALRAVLNVV